MVSTSRPFYVTLPSDASTDLFPSNSASAWITRLRAPISLHAGPWEVALVELIYPHSMYNLPEDQTVLVQQITEIVWSTVNNEAFRYDDQNSTTDKVSFVRSEEEVIIPAGIYDVHQLISIFNTNSPKLEALKITGFGEDRRRKNYQPDKGTPALQFFYAGSERKTRISFSSLRVRLVFPPASRRLQEMLGFQNQSVVSGVDCAGFQKYLDEKRDFNMDQYLDDRRFICAEGEPQPANDSLLWYVFYRGTKTNKTNKWGDPVEALEKDFLVVSKRCINLYFGDQSLFIYCDIAAFTHVGDSVEQLLRVVPIKTDTAFETVMVRFDIPHYSAVVKTFIETIAVDICMDLGKDVPFQSGKSLVKLHFRPART